MIALVTGARHRLGSVIASALPAARVIGLDGLRGHRMIHDAIFGAPAGVDTLVHTGSDAASTRALVLAAAHHPTIRRFVLCSAGAVYALSAREPNLLDEEAPLELAPWAPRWVREHVAADLEASTRLDCPTLQIVVLRLAEVFAEDTGSQLWELTHSRVFLRPLGFDPMINVLSVADYARAVTLAATSDAIGVFNIPGAETLPLTQLVRASGARDVPVPGPLLSRSAGRFHLSGILDGTKARRVLRYDPRPNG